MQLRTFLYIVSGKALCLQSKRVSTLAKAIMNLINWGGTVTLQLRDISNWLIRPCHVLHFVAGVTALVPKRARSVLWIEEASHSDVNSRLKIGSGEYRAFALFLITIQDEIILGLKWTVADLRASHCLFICKWERHWLFPHIWIRGVCPRGTEDLVRLMQQPKNVLFIGLVLFTGIIFFQSLKNVNDSTLQL